MEAALKFAVNGPNMESALNLLEMDIQFQPPCS